MNKYMVIDHTDKDTIYFENELDLIEYVNTWNHTMEIHKRTLSSWELTSWIDREEK